MLRLLAALKEKADKDENLSELLKLGCQWHKLLTSAIEAQKQIAQEKKKDQQEREDALLARNLACEQAMGLPTESNQGTMAALSSRLPAPFVSPGESQPPPKKPRAQPPVSSLSFNPSYVTPTLRGSAAAQWFGERHKDSLCQ